MFCTNCGKENSDNDKFCYNCGSSLKRDKKPVQAQEQVKSRVRQTIENTHSKTHKTVGECISAAWYDMKNLPGWFGRIFLLAFLSMIPIVNFFSFGYFYGLAIHATKKDNSPYPIKIITEQNFIRGFFIAVIGLLLGLVLILCVYPAFYWVSNSNFLLKIIAMFMLLVLIGAIIFLPVIAGLMALRSSLISPSAGFNLSEVFKVASRNTSKNIGMFTLTMIILAIVFLIIGLIFSAIVDSVLTGMISKNSLMMSSALTTNVVNKSALYSKYFSSFFYIYLIAAYVISLVGSVAFQIIIRAQGYYVATFIPEWLNEDQKYKEIQKDKNCQYSQAGQSFTNNSFENLSKQIQEEGSNKFESSISKNLSNLNNVSSSKNNNVAPKLNNLNSKNQVSIKSVKLVAAPGHEFDFKEFPATIGSSKNATLNIGGDENLDDIHFSICLNKDSKICIKDNWTRKGTYLNGSLIKSITESQIKNGDKIKAGNITFDVVMN